MNIRFAIALSAAAASIATSANAVVLSLARYSGGLTGGYAYNGFVPNSVTHISAFGTKTATSTDIGGLRAIASGTSTIAGDGVAEAFVSYKFAVISATPGIIHILVSAAAEAAGSGNYFAEAGVDIFGTRSATAAYAHICHASPGCNSINSVPASGGEVSVLIRANESNTMSLYARGGTFDAGSNFIAWADPTIRFDPAFAHPADASFSFSNNIPNPVLAVPEPASWALMLLGFGLVGRRMRRGGTFVAA